jgi:hypothetical protein
MKSNIDETKGKPFVVDVTSFSIHEFISERCHLAVLKEEEARVAYEKAKQHYAETIYSTEHLSKLLENLTQTS